MVSVLNFTVGLELAGYYDDNPDSSNKCKMGFSVLYMFVHLIMCNRRYSHVFLSILKCLQEDCILIFWERKRSYCHLVERKKSMLVVAF